MKNRQKIDQKSSNRSRGGSWSLSGRLGRVLGCLAAFFALLEASRGVLGGVLAASWGVLGVSLGALGRLLAPLGASWGRLGLDFVAKWSKIEACHLGERFFIDFSSILAPNF